MKKLVLLIGLVCIGYIASSQVVDVGERWDVVKYEKLETYKFSNDTMTIDPADDVLSFGFKAHASNTGDVYMEGRTGTLDGFSSTNIPFDAGEAFNGGLLIAVSDTVIFSSRAAADTCIVTVIKK